MADILHLPKLSHAVILCANCDLDLYGHPGGGEALADRLNATDVLNATLTARFGAVEDLMREMRNDLREISGRKPSP